jgi:hypothetical protein
MFDMSNTTGPASEAGTANPLKHMTTLPFIFGVL